MRGFTENAARILEAAESSREQGELTILMGRESGIQLIADSDWPLDSLAAHHGAEMAYRVSQANGRVRVEGRSGLRRCVLESFPQAGLKPRAG